MYYIILIILLLILINILLYFKQKYDIKYNPFFNYNNNKEYFTPIHCESIDSEYISGEYIGSEFIPNKEDEIILPTGFTFDTNAKVSANIEQFFKLYIKLININFINQKLAQYAGPNVTMQSIFTKNNLTIFNLNNQLQKIDHIYMLKDKNVSNRVIFYYGIYKIIKLKLRNELDNNEKYIYKYKYIIDSECPNKKIIGYDIYLFPKNWGQEKIKEEQKLIPSEHVGSEDKYEKKHTKYCKENEICKIKHKNLYNEDLFDKYENKDNLENYRKNIWGNLNKLIKITELEIVKQLLTENNKKDNLSTFQSNVIVPLNKEILDYIQS